MHWNIAGPGSRHGHPRAPGFELQNQVIGDTAARQPVSSCRTRGFPAAHPPAAAQARQDLSWRRTEARTAGAGPREPCRQAAEFGEVAKGGSVL